MNLRFAIRAVLGATAAAAASYSAHAQDGMSPMDGIEEIIVTAEKREASIQEVPIAVTALTSEAIRAQRIDIAQDLQRAVPNLYFSRAGFGASEVNFQLRGIGYQLVSTAGDAGVGLHVNNVPLSVNRLGNNEMYDMERIEVLRGPQGTLYGRNATGGVINLITAKPTTTDFGGDATVEYGSYDTRRVSTSMNLPLSDSFAVRVAGFALERDGYSENEGEGGDIDGRDLWSGRMTLGYTPNDRFNAYLMWEHTDADDTRTGGLKPLCIKDDGPASVGGVTPNSQARAYLSRGCAQGSVYGEAARSGVVNYTATLAGALANVGGIVTGDSYAGATQNPDLRTVYVPEAPEFKAGADLYVLNLEVGFTDALKLTALSSYLDDEVITRSVVGYAESLPFNSTVVTPGGVFNDPQLGASTTALNLYYNDLDARQWSQELRLQSSFDGAVNFSVGGIYLDLERFNDIYISPTAQNAYVALANLANLSPCVPADCYIDTGAVPDGTGHNYFLSRNPYQLEAKALFGEIYWNMTDSLKLTTGVRYTDDKKSVQMHPVMMLQPGRGWPESGAGSIVDQEARFKEWTGRANLSWQLSDDSMLYASYSKGYKGGGINPPDVATGASSPTYAPEFVNAYEVGAKQSFFDNRVIANVTGFYYDYENYQISQLRGLTATTENIDAKVQGAEFELAWEPVSRLRLNANLGWLDTELGDGSSIDTFDRTQGNPNLSLVKSTQSACVVPTAALAQFLTLMNNGTSFIPVAGGGARPAVARDLLGICGGSFAALGLTPSDGVAVQLEGNELPQAPEFTASVGAQYRWDFSSGWSVTARADYYHQTDAFTRIYNSESDYLESWSNANAALMLDNDAKGWAVQVYAKNIFDKDVITGYDVGSDAVGLVRNASILDPRLIGLTVTKKF